MRLLIHDSSHLVKLKQPWFLEIKTSFFTKHKLSCWILTYANAIDLFANKLCNTIYGAISRCQTKYKSSYDPTNPSTLYLAGSGLTALILTLTELHSSLDCPSTNKKEDALNKAKEKWWSDYHNQLFKLIIHLDHSVTCLLV